MLDNAFVVILLVVVLGAVVGVGFALVRTRQRRPPGIEPPPTAPPIPDEVKEDVERRKADFLRRLEEEEQAGAGPALEESAPTDTPPTMPSASPWDKARRTGPGSPASGTTPTVEPPDVPEPPPADGVAAAAPDIAPATPEAPAPETAPAAVDAELEAAVEEALAPVADATGTDVVDVVELDIDDVEIIDAPPIEAAPVEVPPEAPAPEPAVKPRFRDRLTKARSKLAGVFGGVSSRDRIDEETWEDLEDALISADVGVELTGSVLDAVRARVKADGLTTGDQLLDALKQEMKVRLAGFDIGLRVGDAKPAIWLFVGVNGVGKTTTIGKLGKREVGAGRHVVMAAGDTFRAAAAEQLGMWADRCGADFVRGTEGGDPSAVIFDAVDSAASKGADLVMADTAGRLHTKTNLMDELRKVRRVAEKGDGEVTEVLLVLDATTGQNGLRQAEQFTEAVEVTGVVLTKLDGSAKGGIIFAIQDQLGIPVKLVGLGETADDLVDFDADEFVEALFA